MLVKTSIKVVRRAALVAIAALFAVAVGMPAETQADGAIERLDANFNFMGFEAFTSASAVLEDPTVGVTGGANIYTKTVFVPDGMNTLYVTLSTTGDSHNGAAIWFTCVIWMESALRFSGQLKVNRATGPVSSSRIRW